MCGMPALYTKRFSCLLTHFRTYLKYLRSHVPFVKTCTYTDRDRGGQTVGYAYMPTDVQTLTQTQIKTHIFV